MSDAASIDFRALAHEAVDMLCVASMEGYFLWANRRWEETLGWRLDELRARPFIELVHPEDVDATLTEVGRLGRGELTVSFSNRYRGRDGRYRWLEWNTRPMSDGKLYAVARDVTAQRQALQELERHVQFLRLAEEMGNIGHWRFDLATGALLWSPQVYRIHGHDPETHVPTVQSALEAYHPDDRPKVERLVHRALDRREPYDFVLRMIDTSGKVRRVRSLGRVEVDPQSDEVVALFGVFQDISDSHALQARLSHAEKMASLGTLAAGVAHEINNPLSYIKANAEILAEQLHHPALAGLAELDEATDMIDEVRDGTDRIQKIVRGLKTFSRTSEARPARVRLDEVVATAERLCRNQLKHRARFVTELGQGAADVWGDEGQLVQVAVNLVINAAHAIPDGPADEHQVTVRTGCEAGWTFFEVEDTGSGMTEEVRRSAFSPFFTTKPQGLGTGLGLSICHGIVTAFEGTIDVTSELGIGTRVRVWLPAMQDEASVSIPPSSRHARCSMPRGRVLVIDDELQVGRAFARLLSRHCEVVVEVDPQAAVQRLVEGETPDVILCDVMMPNLSGPALFDVLTDVRPDLTTRLVFVTGGVFGPATREQLEATGAPVLEKPVDGDSLLGLLRERLRVRAA